MSVVTSVDPPANSHDAALTTDISTVFDQSVDTATATSDNFVVYSPMRSREVTVSAEGSTVTATVDSGFFPGEFVQVTATERIQTVGGDPTTPHTWQFRTAVTSGSGVFEDSAQSLGDHDSTGVSLGDLDGDGDLDAFIANSGEHRIWFNDGQGSFSDSGQLLPLPNSSKNVALGDFDQDGDLDALLRDQVWLNDGSGVFEEPRYSRLGRGRINGNSLGDLDGDGDLDIFMTHSRGNEATGGANRVWLNIESNYGVEFSLSPQTLGDHRSEDVALGDLDGDGDLDAFVANGGYQRREGNRVWLNDGMAGFTDSGQSLGDHESRSVALGDLDQDGDLDAFVTTSFRHRVWLNNGSGEFSDSGQGLGQDISNRVVLGDLDADGDLDALVIQGNSLYGGEPNRIWLNDGAATFTDSGQLLGDHTSVDASLGDLDGDGDLDAFITNRTFSNPQRESNRVWLNQMATNEIVLTVDQPLVAESGGVATLTATSTAPAESLITIDLEFTGNASLGADYSVSGPQILIAAGETGGTITVAAIDDLDDEADETVIVDIVSVVGGVEVGEQQVNVTILDDDEPLPASLHVSSFEFTPSGFLAAFSKPLNADSLNLYDAQAAGLGVADITLTGAAVGPVSGSLSFDVADNTVAFVKTGQPLAPDDYTVTLRSAANGFVDTTGALLDGNGDGTAGDDYTTSFTIVDAAVAVVVTVPDFVRGPGQTVNTPANTASGIPVTISDGTNVRAVDLLIDYDPTLLSITSATVAEGVSDEASVVLEHSAPGLAVLSFSSPAPLPDGSIAFVQLAAEIPATDGSGIYSKQHILNLRSVSIRDVDDSPLSAIVDDAVHLVAYFGDVSGNGRVNAADASQVARVAALVETGFASSFVTDPLIIADVTGNDRINAADASLVARFAALIDVPQIPPIPTGIAPANSGRSRRLGILFPVKPNEQPAAEQDSRRSELQADSAGKLSPIFEGAVGAVTKDLVVGTLDDAADEDKLSLTLEESTEELVSAGWSDAGNSGQKQSLQRWPRQASNRLR